MTSIASQIYDAALALVYPQPCAICGQSVESRHDGVVCARCWEATPLFRDSAALCWKCGSLSAASVPNNERRTIRCGRCEDEAFTAARACGNYEGALRASVLELKRRPNLPARVGRLLKEVQQSEPLKRAELIVPVPLYPSRERERGFNQARILAAELAQLTGLSLDEHSLIRNVQTRMHRAGMDAKARRQSVAGAFAVRHADLIKSRDVLLFDDVFTTGATASAAAQALLDRGANAVFVLTIARA